MRQSSGFITCLCTRNGLAKITPVPIREIHQLYLNMRFFSHWTQHCQSRKLFTKNVRKYVIN